MYHIMMHDKWSDYAIKVPTHPVDWLTHAHTKKAHITTKTSNTKPNLSTTNLVHQPVVPPKPNNIVYEKAQDTNDGKPRERESFLHTCRLIANSLA